MYVAPYVGDASSGYYIVYDGAVKGKFTVFREGSN